MTIKDGSGWTFLWVKAHVDSMAEVVEISYQIDGASTSASEQIADPSCVRWSDQQVKDEVGLLLELEEGIDEIQVSWDDDE